MDTSHVKTSIPPAVRLIYVSTTATSTVNATAHLPRYQPQVPDSTGASLTLAFLLYQHLQ